MFISVNLKTADNNNTSSKIEPVYSEIIKNNGFKTKELDADIKDTKPHEPEKVNDVYINLFKVNKTELSAHKIDQEQTTEETKKKGFFLHDPKKPALLPKTLKVVKTTEQSARKTMDESFLSEPKAFNMFSKNDEEPLNLSVNKNPINPIAKNVSMASNSVSKWTDSFEDDELATILGCVFVVYIRKILYVNYYWYLIKLSHYCANSKRNNQK